jgi:uracil-DNA glycosylase family 4
MESHAEYWASRAALEWQVEMGADEAMLDAPVDRYAASADEAAPRAAAIPAPPSRPAIPEPAPAIDAAAMARAAAARAETLDDLRQVISGFEHCELKRGAKNTVFGDGNATARVMIVGEAPGRDEDIEGRPFVGRAGQLLDRMLEAIGLSRTSPDAQNAVYITNVSPWRPPSNRTPDAAEIAMLLPFVQRHIELADPDVIVMVGNTPCQALLGQTGITRLRGNWAQVLGKPALPMFHPAYLLRNPAAKREAWADLLALKARLKSLKKA